MAPGLLGLFSKRDKSKTPRKNKPEDGLQPGIPTPSSAKSSTAPSVDASEQQDGSDLSMETEYVLAEADSPALRNGIYHLGSPGSSSASSTKLKMPFRRRKQSTAPNRFSPSSSKVDLTDTSPPPLPPPKPSYLASRSSSDQSFESLRPPPSRSAIFSSYAEPHSALSTRSLPQDQTHLPLPHDWKQKYETMSNPDPHHPRSPLPTPSPKKPSSSGGGFFSWARPRDRTKSKPSTPAPEPLPSVDSASFNLKSFRHVTSPSPSPIPDRPPSALSSYNVPPARPRPRGESAASDSSQRISVAAFREAQARRSAANSPVPSALGDNLKDSPYLTARRSPSGQPQERGRKRSSTVGAPPPMLDGSPISRLPPPARTQPTRSATAPLFPSSATSTSSEESESEESESEEETLRPSRKRTLTGRKSSKAQSELGHRSQPLSSPFTSPSPSSVPLDRSQGSVPPPSAFETRARPQQLVKNDRTPSVYSRTRASVSTSALVPDAAAKRASLIAKQSNTALRNAEFTRQRVKSSASTSSESSSSGSSEDAPLASFMLPPRSSSATSLTRIPAKPLIDITELTGQSKPAPRRTVDNADFDASARRPGASAPPRAESQDARPRKTSLALGDRLTQLAASATAGSASSQARESDSRSVRAKSPAPGPALNLKVDTRPPPSSYNASSGSETSPPIVPTPIRERPRNPSFTVTSRPTSHASSGSVGTVTALEQAMADEAERNNPTVRMVRSGSPPRDRSLPRPNPNTSNARVPTTTLVSRIPHNDVTGSAPPKPFSGLLRDNSPASSTATGDSSSARMPVTPRDGSELGVPIPIRAYKDSNSSMAGGAKSDVGGPGGKGHRKRASVTFAEEEDPEREAKERRERRRSSVGAEEEVRGRNRAEDKRRERRRSEAKAAIELGNVINGKGPIDDNDDGDVPPSRTSMNMLGGNMGSSRNVPFPTGSSMGFQGQWASSGMSTTGSASAPPGPYPNPMSGNMGMPNMNMPMGMGMDMNMGMNMNPGAMDPRLMAAHQQAMLIAKQTYQMAVAQQAMQNAADEWERGSSVSGWGGGRSSVAPSVMGMPNMQMGMGGMNMGMFPGAPGFGMGMASGGSVIGSGGSVMGGMGGGGGMGMGWPGGGMMFPPAPRSMYGGSVYAGSEVGGPSWGTRSAYGESSGAPRDRSSRVPRQSHVPPVPPLSAGAVKREGPRARTKTAPSGVGQGAAQGQGLKKRGEAQGLVGAVSPPSSWKGQ